MPKFVIVLLSLMLATTTQARVPCETKLPTLPPPHPAALAPLAEGFAAIPPKTWPQASGLSGVDLTYSVQRVLHRRQLARCREAIAVALTPVAAPVPADDGYVKKTEFDNTPYRFNMTQGGRRMSADDFDAWLKDNGHSVGRRAGSDVIKDQ